MRSIYINQTITALCAVLTLIILSAHAHAQSQLTTQLRAEGESFARTPPSLIAPAITYGGFKLNPKLTVINSVVDNVFYSQNNTTSDIVTAIQPSIDITKFYRDHSLKISAMAEDKRYYDLTDENNTTYDATAALNLQATKSLKIPFRIRHQKDTLSRSMPGTSRFTQTPLYSFRSNASTGIDYRFNRLALKLLGNYERRSFDDGTSNVNGEHILLSDNDRTSTGVSLLATYNIPRSGEDAPEHTLFAGLTIGKQKFDAASDSSGTDTSSIRSNKNVSFLAGLKTRYKDILTGDIGIGYITYDYDSPLAESVDSFDLEADISYLITPKLTLNFAAEREINQDSNFVQGFIKTLYTLGAEYEFLHNLYGSLNASYENADFINNTREDNTYGTEAALRYIHSARLESRASILLETRDSNITGSDYDQMIMRIGIAGKL